MLFLCWRTNNQIAGIVVLTAFIWITVTLSDANGQSSDCEPGLYGPWCDLPCSKNCAGKRPVCDRNNGACLLGCKENYLPPLCRKCSTHFYGDGCYGNCSNCNKDGCDDVIGRCVSGCHTGWRGEDCDKVCEPTTFGVNCSQPCSKNCEDQLCDSTNGDCVRCKSGLGGQDCTLQLDASTAKEEGSIITYIMGIVFATVIVCCIVYLVAQERPQPGRKFDGYGHYAEKWEWGKKDDTYVEPQPPRDSDHRTPEINVEDAPGVGQQQQHQDDAHSTASGATTATTTTAPDGGKKSPVFDIKPLPRPEQSPERRKAIMARGSNVDGQLLQDHSTNDLFDDKQEKGRNS